MSDRRDLVKRQKTEWILGLGVAVVVIAAGVWFFTKGDGGARRVDGPEQAAVIPESPEVVDLDNANEVAAVPSAPTNEQRVSVAAEAPAEEVVEPPALPAGEGSISGSFSLPGGVPAAALVTLKTVAREEQGDEVAHYGPVHLEFGARDPWQVENLGPGKYRLQATIEHDERIWTSSILEVELAKNAESKGHQLILVEYGVEGLVLDGNGMGVAGTHVEISWSRPLEDLAFEDANPWLSSGILLDGNHRISFTHSGDGELTSILYTDPTEMLEGEYEIAVPRSDTDVWSSNVIIDSATSIAFGEAEEPMIHSTIEVPTIPQVLFDSAEGESIIADLSTLEEHMVSLSEVFEEMQEIEEEPIEPPKTTDASGRYRLALPGPGHYGLRVNGVEVEVLAKNGEIEVSEIDPFAVHDFEVVRAASLSGRVSIYSGESPAGVYCFLKLSSTDTEGVDEEGNFRFDRLWPGTYHFYARGGGDSGQDFSYHCMVEIVEGGNHNINPILEPSFEVKGQLTGATGEYANMRVIASGKTNSSLTREAEVMIDGSFTIRGLYASEYELTVRNRKLTEEVVFFVDVENPTAFLEADVAPRASESK